MGALGSFGGDGAGGVGGGVDGLPEEEGEWSQEVPVGGKWVG